jgi:hypothetical protein
MGAHFLCPMPIGLTYHYVAYEVYSRSWLSIPILQQEGGVRFGPIKCTPFSFLKTNHEYDK